MFPFGQYYQQQQQQIPLAPQGIVPSQWAAVQQQQMMPGGIPPQWAAIPQMMPGGPFFPQFQIYPLMPGQMPNMSIPGQQMMQTYLPQQQTGIAHPPFNMPGQFPIPMPFIGQQMPPQMMPMQFPQMGMPQLPMPPVNPPILQTGRQQLPQPQQQRQQQHPQGQQRQNQGQHQITAGPERNARPRRHYTRRPQMNQSAADDNEQNEIDALINELLREPVNGIHHQQQIPLAPNNIPEQQEQQNQLNGLPPALQQNQPTGQQIQNVPPPTINNYIPGQQNQSNVPPIQQQQMEIPNSEMQQEGPPPPSQQIGPIPPQQIQPEAQQIQNEQPAPINIPAQPQQNQSSAPPIDQQMGNPQPTMQQEIPPTPAQQIGPTDFSDLRAEEQPPRQNTPPEELDLSFWNLDFFAPYEQQPPHIQERIREMARDRQETNQQSLQIQQQIQEMVFGRQVNQQQQERGRTPARQERGRTPARQVRNAHSPSCPHARRSQRNNNNNNGRNNGPTNNPAQQSQNGDRDPTQRVRTQPQRPPTNRRNNGQPQNVPSSQNGQPASPVAGPSNSLPRQQQQMNNTNQNQLGTSHRGANPPATEFETMQFFRAQNAMVTANRGLPTTNQQPIEAVDCSQGFAEFLQANIRREDSPRLASPLQLSLEESYAIDPPPIQVGPPPTPSPDFREIRNFDDKFKTYRVKSYHTGEDNKCTLCQDVFILGTQTLCVLPECEHFFHHDCLFEYLGFQYRVCPNPNCQTPIDMRRRR